MVPTCLYDTINSVVIIQLKKDEEVQELEFHFSKGSISGDSTPLGSERQSVTSEHGQYH